MREFSKKQVADKVGIKPRLVQFYTEEGIVTPELNAGQGRGRVRKYSKKNLLEFCIVKQLSTYGLMLQKIHQVIKLFRMKFDSPRLSAKGKTFVHKGSVIDNWEKIPFDSYLILYQRQNGKFHYEIVQGLNDGLIIQKEYMKKSTGALILNIGLIVSQIKNS